MFEGVYLLGEWNGVATARSHVVIRKLYFLGFRKQIKSDKIHGSCRRPKRMRYWNNADPGDSAKSRRSLAPMTRAGFQIGESTDQ